MATLTEEDRTGTFEDTPEMHKKEFDHLIAWFHEHGCYSGESIMQSDAPQLTAVEMLSDLAEETKLSVKVNWFLMFDAGVVTIKECDDGGPEVVDTVETGAVSLENAPR